MRSRERSANRSTGSRVTPARVLEAMEAGTVKDHVSGVERPSAAWRRPDTRAALAIALLVAACGSSATAGGPTREPASPHAATPVATAAVASATVASASTAPSPRPLAVDVADP